MDANLPFIAGIISTTMFALSTFPMLRKAFRTKDLGSYSLGNIVLANAGNAIHSVYVFHLPPGPIWLLHGFYLVTTSLMLFWYLRYEGRPHWSGHVRFPGASSLPAGEIASKRPERQETTPSKYHLRGMSAR